MKKYLLTGFLLAALTAFAQDFNFDIHHTTLAQYIQMEKDLGSELSPTTTKFLSLDGDAQPIRFIRKEEVIPDLVALYFFKAKDSSMSYIRYKWDIESFDQTSNNPQDEKVERAFIDKYLKLEEMISSQFGKGAIEGSLENFDAVNTLDGLEKKSTWTPDDSTKIELSIFLRNFYEKTKKYTHPTRHRINLYIRNTSKKANAVPKLDEVKIDELTLIVKNFINTLKTKDYAKAKEFLSELIINQVTDEQLNAVIDALYFDREIELGYSGIQTGPDGSPYTFLQYKYADDNNNPQNDIIKVMFDDKDKIAGFQPLKHQGEAGN